MTSRKRSAEEAGLDSGYAGGDPREAPSSSLMGVAPQDSEVAAQRFWGGIEAMLAEAYERNFERLEVLRQH